jgi:hypothetical protein
MERRLLGGKNLEGWISAKGLKAAEKARHNASQYFEKLLEDEDAKYSIVVVDHKTAIPYRTIWWVRKSWQKYIPIGLSVSIRSQRMPSI